MAVTEEQGRYIEQIFKNMHGGLHSYALSALQNKFLAEEAIQEAFCIVCEKPQDMLTSPNPNGWVMKVLKNVLRNMKRREATRERYFIAAQDVGVEQIQDPRRGAESDIDLMYADLIGEEAFYLLKQVIVERRTILDMAEEIGISVSACKKRFWRAEERFRKEIKKIDETDVP